MFVYFQPPTDEENKIAWGRAYGPETSDPFEEVKMDIKRSGYPKVVAIGSSHVTHWATYRRSKRTSSDDKRMLQNFYFAGVGGTRLINCICQIGGQDLPPRKRYLGNQWLKMKRRMPNPDYVILAVGSNDCDEADRYASARMRRGMSDKEYKKETFAELAKWYKDLKDHQLNVVSKIRKVYKGVRIYFLPILPRRWWGQYARRMAVLLNRHMISMENTHVLNADDLFAAKESNINKNQSYMDNIINGLLDWDRTHLNPLGYHILTKKSVLSLSVHKYGKKPEGPKEPEAPKVKVSRRYQRTLSKRRRLEDRENQQ